MHNSEFEIFIESLRTDNNSELVDTILEGFVVSQQQYQMEGIGDTFRNAKNRIKTIGASGKEAIFGASEEQTFKNAISRTILNKKLYDSNSRIGQGAIKKIVSLIAYGTQHPSLPNAIAQLADDVLIDCIESALSSNPTVKVKILRPMELRNNMDVVFDEIANSVVKPLAKLGRMRLNDDRLEFVTEWWEKNVVPKMGKYFDVLNSADLKIEPKKEKPPRKPTPRKPSNNANKQQQPDFTVDSNGNATNRTKSNKTKKNPMPPPPRPEE
jgi:hypothetical protein